MTSDIVKNNVNEINRLHEEVAVSVEQIRVTGVAVIEKAIKIGELLTECKNEIPFGEWEQWVRINLPFDVRQAQRYMKVYRERQEYYKDPEHYFVTGWRTLMGNTVKQLPVKSSKDLQEEPEESEEPEAPPAFKDVPELHPPEPIELEYDVKKDLLPLLDKWSDKVYNDMAVAFSDAYDDAGGTLRQYSKVKVNITVEWYRREKDEQRKSKQNKEAKK
jgi:hypothetical protein